MLRPSRDDVRALLERPNPAWGYSEVGATADAASLPALAARYDIDRHRFSLGSGRALFERARDALLSWRHFEIPWLELHGGMEHPQPGRVVATVTRAAGLWFVNPCRVVYAEDQLDPLREAAFAYGTLSGHVESGEERFAIRFDPSSGEVGYEIVAFSRPAIFLSKLTYRWVRRFQQRFAAASAEALSRACR